MPFGLVDRLQALGVEQEQLLGSARVGRAGLLKVQRRAPEPKAFSLSLHAVAHAKSRSRGARQLVEDEALASAIDACDGDNTNSAVDLTEVGLRLFGDEQPIGRIHLDEGHRGGH